MREDPHALRLTSELVDLRAGDANWIRRTGRGKQNKEVQTALSREGTPSRFAKGDTSRE